MRLLYTVRNWTATFHRDHHLVLSRPVVVARSEQVKKSGAEGARLSEAIEINKSLTTLGRVVDALVRRSRQPASLGRVHVPYYESRLTTLLAPALGGAARTTVVVTASPDDAHADETLHALRFATRPGWGTLRPLSRSRTTVPGGGAA